MSNRILGEVLGQTVGATFATPLEVARAGCNCNSERLDTSSILKTDALRDANETWVPSLSKNVVQGIQKTNEVSILGGTDLNQPTPRILGRTSSANVQKVLWLLNEIGVDSVQDDYGGKFGRTTEADYIRINPNATIPTLHHEDFILWESNSICRYLGSYFNATSLYPPNLRLRAKCEQWMDWELGVLFPKIAPLYVQLVRVPEAQRDHATIKLLCGRVEKSFLILNDALDDQRFVLGTELTLADLGLGIWTHRWVSLGLCKDKNCFGRLLRWYERIAVRPAFCNRVKSVAFE